MNMKRKEGITLIALVITIIVLLILAGVSIAMLTGQNGILTQAQNAKNRTEQAEKEEKEKLGDMEDVINEAISGIEIEQVIDENPGKLETEGIDTYIINSIEDLVFFSYDVTTNGNTYNGKTVKLGTNLDFNSDKSYVDANRTDFIQYGYNGPLKEVLTSKEGFKPIGQTKTSVGTNCFYGIFDGDNKVICSLYINMDKNETIIAGLFSTSYGEVKNLGLYDVNIQIKGIEGALTSVAGLCGITYSNIYNSYVTGNINVIGDSWTNVGGICGVKRNSGSIGKVYNLAEINCTNIAKEQGENNIACGGITGGLQDCQGVSVEECYNKGTINANGGNVEIVIGGILGTTFNNVENAVIKNCYNNAKVQGSTQSTNQNYVAGVASVANSTSLLNCYNSGNVVGIKNGNILGDIFTIGGIVGIQSTDSEINNIFNSGKIIVENGDTNFRIGGIIGRGASKTPVKVNNAYNIGLIEADGLSSEQVGSISGNSEQLNFNNCYYLAETYDVGVGGNETPIGIKKIDEASEIPSILSIINGGSAFKEDTNNINNGNPILKWQ